MPTNTADGDWVSVGRTTRRQRPIGNQPIELARRARGEELNEGKGDWRRKDRARLIRRGYPQDMDMDMDMDR